MPPKEPVAVVVETPRTASPPAVAEPTPARVEPPVAAPETVPTPAPVAVVEEPTPIPVQVQAPPPDVIPTQREHPEPEIIATLPPPAAFTNSPSPEPVTVVSSTVAGNANSAASADQDQIYSNVDIINEQAANANQIAYATTTITDDQIDLAEYIEDTGLRAIALYDYEATADDEISFDPNEIITHIEQIDEGWWRGLCRNRYGLFPANYVQLQK